MNTVTPIPPVWHSIGSQDASDVLDTTQRGLTQVEAGKRLADYGPNRLPQMPPTPMWAIALRQFRSPLIYILGLAAIVSIAMGDVKDAVFIFGVLGLNAVIGSWQEWKAAKSNHALKKLLQIHATVQRDGEVCEIDAEDVVPGDVILLESGNRVPADIRLQTSDGLEVDESLLTGESLPAAKNSAWDGAESTPLADRKNMTHAGSIVTRGRGKGIVVATGHSTSVGQLALDVVGDPGGDPPLVERMAHFTRMIAVVVLVASGFIGVLGVTLGGYSVVEMFSFAVALAVASIPEGLPVAMTIALAVATTRMAKRGLIVRRLTAVEGLGSCTLIATDKTGTVTCNEVTVREVHAADGTVFQVTGEGFLPVGEILLDGSPLESRSYPHLDSLLYAGVLCNEADLYPLDGTWSWRGDAVDVAFLALGQKRGVNRIQLLERYPQVGGIPYESEHQFAAAYNQTNEGLKVFLKGSPERVLAMCTSASGTAFDAARFEEMAASLAERGYRVLAIADGDIEEALANGRTPSDLRFLGFVGMIDPLRPEVKQAICECKAAGVNVSMITGDHRSTALSIAKQLGLATEDGQVMTGEELLNTTPEQLEQIVGKIRVFARVAPHQKLDIVEAARRAGHFVAVTGDGVNDAPALRASNIGVAMGKSGTDIAREAAELVISDDNFSTLVGGVEQGRIAYDNIRKVIYFLISTGAAEIVLMFLAIATGTPYLPLLPVQILWLNLVTSGIQDVALAFEPDEGGVLKRKPRMPSESIFNQLMIERTLIAALVMGGIGFMTFQWYVPEGASEAQVASARNALLLLLVLFENVHIGNCRSETKSAFVLSPLRSPMLLAGVIGALGIHVAAMHTSLGHYLLGAEPLPLQQWSVLMLLALTILPVMELHKWSWYKRHQCS